MTEQRDRFLQRNPTSRLFFAGFLIVAGTLLFLGNLGILPVRSIWLYWPLIVVGLGISRIISGPELVVRLFGALIAFVGTLFLLINLEVIHISRHDGSWPISILLIALGLAMLIKVMDKREPSPSSWTNFRPLRLGSIGGYTDFTILASLKRRLDSADFPGAAALSVLGTIEIDLRRARIADPSQTARLELSTVLGEAKVRVPDDWHIRVLGSCILGTYENKTVPTNIPIDAPTLVITGYSILGSVEILD
jgi:hypothetical protein